MKKIPHLLSVFLFSLILVSACGGASPSAEPVESKKTVSATESTGGAGASAEATHEAKVDGATRESDENSEEGERRGPKVSEEEADRNREEGERRGAKVSQEEADRNRNYNYVDQWAEICTGSGPVMFANSPMRIEDIKFLTPYGEVVGGHVTPIDHMYFEPKDRSLGRDAYEVRIIQDAIIYAISPRDINVDTNEERSREWRIDMAHTCTFTSYFDLLTSLAPDIEKEWSKTEGGRTARWNGISVKAGQLIGYIGAQTLDFGVYDYEITLPGLINPSAYESLEPWKIHTVDPFQYFPSEIRDALLRKMIRAVEPRAGKIDYDVDGTISGNWFQQGTNGYSGVNQRKYWEGHLSIAPHEIDPTFWRIAVGFLETEDNNFIIFGDQDPLEVNISSGPIVYELKRGSIWIPAKPQKKWWIDPFDEDDVYAVTIYDDVGSVLLELQGDRLLRVEVFLGIEKEKVSGFTDDARLYER